MSCIINCDETAITYDSPLSYSLAKVGLKIVTIKTTEKEKYRVTCLLSITADGGKLKPFIIFKGKKDAVINKELEEFVKSKKYDIITKTQVILGLDGELSIDYINPIIIKYKKDKQKLLILYYYPAHCTYKVTINLKENNIDFIFIPKNDLCITAT